jgi:predicted Zn-dependent protease with MMP-like domain
MPRLSMAEFKRCVKRVLDTLPAELKAHMGNVVVDVEEEPDERTLRRAGFTAEEIAAGESLLGLFAPFPVNTEALELNERPHRLIIYKLTHEEAFETRRQLLTEIRKTVIHELAHHFGWSEADLERFDNTPDPFPESSFNMEDQRQPES